MDKKSLANILGSSGLPQEIVEELQEAFDAKVAAAREEAETSIREEFSRRYEHDKGNLVEAMDRMLTDAVKKHAEERSAEVAKLAEARSKFQNAIKESKTHYKTKLKEHVSLTRDFAVEQLSKEAAALRSQKVALAEAKKALRAEVTEMKKTVSKEQTARLKKIDEFVVRQVSKELAEFGEDKRALVETRVKLVSEGKKKLAEAHKKFIAESAAKVESMVNESLKREMTQLHEDLERNRQNMFGRRIFEAVAAEYMTSYLAEGTEARKLQSVLESTQAELADTKSKLNEVESKTEAARRKASLAEQRAERKEVMSELLSNMRGDKKAVMEGMLETVKTSSLRDAFTKFLPVVLNEGGRQANGAKTLTEGPKQEKRVVTVKGGDQRANRLFESAKAEDDVDSAILADVVRLAGIK